MTEFLLIEWRRVSGFVELYKGKSCIFHYILGEQKSVVFNFAFCSNMMTSSFILQPKIIRYIHYIQSRNSVVKDGRSI